MKKSRFLASLVLVVMLIAIPLQAFGSTPSPWAAAEIEKAKSFNLVTEKVLRDYKGNITREEFCELAVKLYESLSGKEAARVIENPFTDTSNPEILKANKLGIVDGRGKGIFAPNDPVTRQEIAVMLYRTISAAEIHVPVGGEIAKFADEAKIAKWALEAVVLLNSHQIINGDGTNINPLGNTTREQGIALVVRTYEKFYNQKSDKLSYEEYAVYLYWDRSLYTYDDVTLDFFDVTLFEDNGYLYLYYYLDLENLEILEGALIDGIISEDEILELLADVVLEVEEYFNKSVIGYITWLETGFNANPIPEGLYSIITDSDSIYYNSMEGTYYIWFPILEIFSDRNSSDYQYMWAY